VYFRHYLFLILTICLISAFGSPIHAAGPPTADKPVTDKKDSDDSTSKLNLVPGWSCSQSVGAAGEASKSDSASKSNAVSKNPKPKTLDLSGAENNYFYGSYGQLGSRGFFGDYNVDRSSTGVFANLNGWVGNPRLQAFIVPGGTAATPDIVNDLVSGTGASVSSVVLNITPHYGNDWVDVKARYTINAYSTSASPGAAVPIALPQLTLWQAKVSTPIADIALGKTIFQRGCSLQFSWNRTAEYLMLQKSYCVPNILGCLVCAGVLPPRVMSWFNPELWPRYSPGQQNELGEPEYQLYGGDSTSKKSIFDLMEQCRQKKEGEQAQKPTAKATTEIKPICADTKNVNTGTTKGSIEATTKEVTITPTPASGEKSPSEKDQYAWNYLTPGCLRVGFGFIGWEVPTVYPTDGAILGPSTQTPFTAHPLASPFNTNLWNRNDFAVNALNNIIGAVTYSSSDLEFGVGCLRSTYHQGPEVQPWFHSNLPDPLTPSNFSLSLSTPTFERYVTEGWAYLKYNNGRFFFETELDWFNRVYRFQRSQDGTFFGQANPTDGSGSLFASRYWESWRYMVEVGARFGPLAGRFFYSFMPGPDRRHGVYIDRQPFIQDFPQQACGLFDPYSTILSFRFGSGVNAPGHISDASVFAFKLDYLLASNLLIEGSFLKAVRNSHGYPMGYIRPDTTSPSNFGRVVYGEPPGSTFTTPAPSIPDRDLGWEAMASIVWELMDGWAIKGQIAYWQPGRWFNYACIDKGVPNWNITPPPLAPPNLGINPDRKIDPVLGWEIYIGASY
jgi:hypothetical protein